MSQTIEDRLHQTIAEERAKQSFKNLCSRLIDCLIVAVSVSCFVWLYKDPTLKDALRFSLFWSLGYAGKDLLYTIFRFAQVINTQTPKQKQE